jgi:hypothetical protein
VEKQRTFTFEAIMKILGVLGVCALLFSGPALAVGYSDGYGRGGPFRNYDPIIAKFNASGELFVIRGLCQSACTLFLTIRNACMAPNARFGFHAGWTAMAMSRFLNSYNPKLRDFLVSVGAMKSPSFTYVSAHDIVAKYGYRSCPH